MTQFVEYVPSTDVNAYVIEFTSPENDFLTWSCETEEGSYGSAIAVLRNATLTALSPLLEICDEYGTTDDETCELTIDLYR